MDSRFPVGLASSEISWYRDLEMQAVPLTALYDLTQLGKYPESWED
jgi:hypothetical protein